MARGNRALSGSLIALKSVALTTLALSCQMVGNQATQSGAVLWASGTSIEQLLLGGTAPAAAAAGGTNSSSGSSVSEGSACLIRENVAASEGGWEPLLIQPGASCLGLGRQGLWMLRAFPIACPALNALLMLQVAC